MQQYITDVRVKIFYLGNDQSKLCHYMFFNWGCNTARIEFANINGGRYDFYSRKYPCLGNINTVLFGVRGHSAYILLLKSLGKDER